MPEPFQSGEDGSRILASTEGCVVIEEAFSRFKLHQFIVIVHDREVKWIAGLVASIPEVRHTTHVGVSRGVNGGDEPLGTGLGVVGHHLGDVFLRVGFTVAIRIVVSLNPVIEVEFHWMADAVLNKDLNHLFDVRCFVGVLYRSNLLAFRMSRVHEVGAAPFGVGLLHMVGVSLVVGLNLVGQAVRNVNGRQVNGDKEGTVVVGGVPGGAFHVAVSRNTDVKRTVFGCVVGVLEPHGAHEVKLFSGRYPGTAFHVH